MRLSFLKKRTCILVALCASAIFVKGDADAQNRADSAGRARVYFVNSNYAPICTEPGYVPTEASGADVKLNGPSGSIAAEGSGCASKSNEVKDSIAQDIEAFNSVSACPPGTIDITDVPQGDAHSQDTATFSWQSHQSSDCSSTKGPIYTSGASQDTGSICMSRGAAEGSTLPGPAGSTNETSIDCTSLNNATPGKITGTSYDASNFCESSSTSNNLTGETRQSFPYSSGPSASSGPSSGMMGTDICTIGETNPRGNTIETGLVSPGNPAYTSGNTSICPPGTTPQTTTGQIGTNQCGEGSIQRPNELTDTLCPPGTTAQPCTGSCPPGTTAQPCTGSCPPGTTAQPCTGSCPPGSVPAGLVNGTNPCPSGTIPLLQQPCPKTFAEKLTKLPFNLPQQITLFGEDDQLITIGECLQPNVVETPNKLFARCLPQRSSK